MKPRKNDHFAYPLAKQVDNLYDDLADYHSCCEHSGKRTYYNLLYITLQEISDLEPTYGLP